MYLPVYRALPSTWCNSLRKFNYRENGWYQCIENSYVTKILIEIIQIQETIVESRITAEVPYSHPKRTSLANEGSNVDAVKSVTRYLATSTGADADGSAYGAQRCLGTVRILRNDGVNVLVMITRGSMFSTRVAPLLPIGLRTWSLRE